MTRALVPLLAGGDRRSLGKSKMVVALVLKQTQLFAQVFAGMQHADPVIRMRCADVAEKVTRHKPELLAPFKRRLLREVALSERQEVRWHVAQMLARLQLSRRERRTAHKILSHYLADESRIVKTFAMQALADLAESEAALRVIIFKQLEQATRSVSPAMKSRGKKLLLKLRQL